MLLDPAGVVYASIKGDCSHLYRSTDGGATWSRGDIMLASPLDGYGCSRNEEGTLRLLAVDPTTPATLYAGVPFSASSGRGLWRSSDGGVSWRPAGLHSHILSLALTPSALYAGTSSGGVYRSDDRGLTWRAASEGLTGFSVSELAVDPTTPMTLYAATDNGVHKSDDGGATWRAVGLPGQLVRALAVIPTTPTTLYAGVSYGDEPGVYKSTDGGETWRAIRVARSADPDTGGRSDYADHAVCRRPGRGRAAQRRWRRDLARRRVAGSVGTVAGDPSYRTCDSVCGNER
jgi:photosystem II stability/assembly factor-like uncharacterized protein